MSETEAERVHTDLFGEIVPPDFNDEAEIVNHHVEEFISMQKLLPDALWINREVIMKGKGHEVPLLRLHGKATKSDRTPRQMKDGSWKDSIGLHGTFEAVSLITGDVYSSNTAYLPEKWAKRAEEALAALPKDDPAGGVSMVLTVGCRATGGQPQHTWTVTTHIKPPSSPEMDELRKFAKMVGQYQRHQRLTHSSQSAGNAD